ncbi:zinc finger transcription factor [Scheffersomyces xylosifermentans]|uniref:zinc finger transcription factor n=1 Tax=Scheffersomyces xylosifermentans TaxID=1304137 RepID=UPI00315DF091
MSVQKQRQRKTYSCSNCKERKRKCDRNKPCSSCVRSAIASTCRYKVEDELPANFIISSTPETAPVENPIRIATEVPQLQQTDVPAEEKSDDDELKSFLKEKNPVGLTGTKFNFFKLLQTNVIDVECNIFSWVNLYRSDPGMKLYSKHSKANILFLNSITVDDFKQDASYKGFIQTEMEKVRRRSLGVGCNVFKDNNQDLLATIHRTLPDYEVCGVYIEKFFNELYPCFPFLDEDVFKGRLSKIPFLTSVTDEDDWAVLGILLIIIRMSYLSCLWNMTTATRIGVTPNSDDFQLIRRVSIGPEFIRLAKMCLNQFDPLVSNSMWMLQCSLYLRIYERVSPEAGECSSGRNTQIVHSSLIQQALDLKLHIDPDYLPQVYRTNEKYKNLARKIWHFLVSYDYLDSICYGNYPSTTKVVFNTKLPIHVRGNENIYNTQLEKEIVESFEYLDFTYGPVHDLLVDIQSMKTDHRIEKIVFLLNAIETTTASIYGDNESFFTSSAHFHKGLRFALYLYFKFFLVTLYSYLQLYYEKNGQYEQSFFYLKKVLVVGTYELLPSVIKLICSFRDYFSKEIFMLTPQIVQLTCHRLVITLLSTYIRLEVTTRRVSGLDIEVIDQIKKKILQILHLHHSVIASMSSEIHYSWRIRKSLYFIIHKIFKGQLFDDEGLTELEVKRTVFRFSSQQYGDLNKSLQTCLDTVEKIWQPELLVPFSSIDRIESIYRQSVDLIAYDGSDEDKMWYRVSRGRTESDNGIDGVAEMTLKSVKFDFNIFKGLFFKENVEL